MKVLDKRKNNGGARQNSGRRKTTTTLYSQRELREILHVLVQENDCKDFREIVYSLVTEAKTNPKAAAYVLDQLIGKPSQVIPEAEVGKDKQLNVNDEALQIIREYGGGVSS